MFSIFFSGKCFVEFESSLYLISAAKSEAESDKCFINEVIEYLILEKAVQEEYKHRQFVEATDDDICLMKSIIANMKKAVHFDFENICEFYTLSPEHDCEHMMLLKTDNYYMMLYWCTTA